MKDERIQTTASHFAAMGFSIWCLLMSMSLCYRVLILKQLPRQWWDILAIFVIGTLFVFIAYASKGVLDHGAMKALIVGMSGALVAVFAVSSITGRMYSVGAFLIGFLPAAGLVIATAYFLNQRWKRKEGIDDKK